MQTVRDLEALRNALRDLRAAGHSIALVPTMGALHDGHMALVAEARRRAEAVVVSIFVNPKQFGPKEDLARYPRPEEADARLLEAAGVDLLWMPGVDQMYPQGFATTVSVAGLGDGLCGAARPGHFDGVATVVTKLFAQVRPDIAVFGEKDWQQLAIVRRMTADLDLGVEVIGLATVREADGLARSSRNAYLSSEERARAAALPLALLKAASAIEGGASVAATLEAARERIAEAGFGPIDYIELVDAATLEPLESAGGDGRLVAAARLGNTRLIDNVPVRSKNLNSR